MYSDGQESKLVLEFVAVGGEPTTPLCPVVNGGGNCHIFSEIFNKLKATIVYDKDMHSMADLFNEAAEKYLKEKEAGGKDQ